MGDKEKEVAQKTESFSTISQRTMPLNELKRKVLYNLGINRADLSHYKHGRFDRISKKKMKWMKLVLEHEIIETKDFQSLNNVDSKYKYVLLIHDLPQL